VTKKLEQLSENRILGNKVEVDLSEKQEKEA